MSNLSPAATITMLGCVVARQESEIQALNTEVDRLTAENESLRTAVTEMVAAAQEPPSEVPPDLPADPEPDLS